MIFQVYKRYVGSTMASSTLIILISVNVKNFKNHFSQRVKFKEEFFENF
jgi:hypothetical protein